MPKIIIETKFAKDDIVYFIHHNGIMQGRVNSINVYNGWGILPEEDNRCIHQKLEDRIAEIGDEVYDPMKPILELTVEILHPIIAEMAQGKPIYERIMGTTRVFRKPEALLEYLKRKFEKAYEQKINLEVKRSED